MANTPQSRKNKGRSGQKEVRKALLEAFPDLEGGDILSRSMGASGTDLHLSPQAKRLIPFDWEVKYCEKWKIPEWWEQTKANSENKPVLAFRKNNDDWKVVIKLEDFIELLRNQT